MRLRVGAAIIADASTREGGMLTLSLEEPPPPTERIVEMTLYTNALQRDPTVFETITMKMGDPFVTGYAQVVAKPGEEPAGFFDVKRWVPNSIGGYAEQMWTTGMFPDANMPALVYFAPPAQWPALPDHWQ